MRFLHTADVHLDSPLRGLDEYEGAPVQELRGATRKAFENLIQLAVAERVDFVILAGDLYDGDWQDYNTGLFFLNGVRELDRAGIPLVLITGNHDAASRITARLTLPPNVHRLPTHEAGTIRFENLQVALHGQGFARQAETRNLAVTYPVPVPGCFNIGVLHTALDGREGHDNYAPCTIEELVARGYDYWALGHIHKRESVNGDKHPRIEFPGNLQGRHIRETGAKGCLLVSVDADGQTMPEFRALDAFRWEAVSVDASAAESKHDVLEFSREAISVARDCADGRPLAARVVISCSESIHRDAASDLDEFRANLRGQTDNDVWIEKIKFDPIRPTEAEQPLLGEDAMSEMRAVLDEMRDQPDAVRALFSSGECDRLVNRLPPALRTAFDQSLNDMFDRASELLQSRSPEPTK